MFRLKPGDSEFRLILGDIAKAEAVLFKGGLLYVGNREGLHVYDGKRLKTITVGTSPMGIENSVRDITSDGKGRVWFASRYAVNCYNPETATFRSWPVARQMPERAALSRLAVCGDRFYVGTKNNGLYVCRLDRGEVTPVDGLGNVISSVCVNRRGEVCVASDGGGAFLIDGKTARIKERFASGGALRHGIPTNSVYSYCRTEHGTDWIGLYRSGVSYTFFSQPLFRTYSTDFFTTEGMNVRSFYIGDGEKAVGTNNGVYFVDGRTHTVRHITPEELGGAHIITDIYAYRGKYYIASYDAGQHVFDPATSAVSTVPGMPVLANTTIASFATDRDGRLWIGTAEGIFVLDKDGKVEHFTENNSRLCRGVVSSIFFDSNSNGWVASEGLSFYTAATHTFENANFPDKFFNNERTLGISQGHDGMLLFNRQSRVFYSNLSMSRFGEIALPQELLGGINYAFLDDLKGHYWFATDNGLFSTDYRLGSLQHFGYGEGLRCQYVNTGAVKTDGNGNVWVGTSNGLMRVDHKAMQRWQHDSEFRIFLYDVRKGSDLMDFDTEDKINRNRRIYVSWNLFSQKTSFRMVLLDYARQNGRLYQWRMSGEKEWHRVNDGEDVVLGALFLGRHDIYMRLAGAPGTEIAYKVIVYPSALAVMEFVLLLTAIVLFVLWRRYHKDTRVLLNERDEIENALMEAEMAQQNAEMQLQRMEDQRIQQNVGLRLQPIDEIVPDKTFEDGQGAEASKEEKTATAKYSRVRLNEAESAAIVARMRACIEEKRPFTNSDLKMSDIAEALHLSSSRLSQVFILYLGENYYEFINGYRLREFKRLIAEGAYRRFTLTALSEQCGFKKSSFFSTFRRVEGMTPTEYLKKQNIKI